MASLVKRGTNYYLQDRKSGRIVRTSLRTDSLQVAKEKLRQYESAKHQGLASTLPTRTPVGDVLERYVAHIRTHKTGKSAQTDVYYLREAFGPVCTALHITSRRVTERCRKRALVDGATFDRRRRPHAIEAACFEHITAAQVSHFIECRVRSRGLAPKTANRYREILCRLFNWAMKTQLVRMPGSLNPAQAVERYRERAPEIRYLTLPQIREQLDALADAPQLQVTVAVLIYAGLRREELLWLTPADIDCRQGPSGHGWIRVRAKTVAGESWQPKTRRNRQVPVSADLHRWLRPHWATARDRTWVFTTPTGARWDPDNFSSTLREENRRKSLRWTCLHFRHTFGSQLAQAGNSLFAIAELMGISPEIARRHYAALAPSSLIGAVEFPKGDGSSAEMLKSRPATW